MRIGKFRIASLVILCFVAILLVVRHRHQTPTPAPSQHGNSGTRAGIEYVLLPASEAVAYSKFLTGGSKAEVQSWEPTVADIEGLEANLAQLQSAVENGQKSGRHIDDPHRYLRQYVAFTQDGTAKIYVNAFCSAQGSDPNEWHKHLVIALDGGTCFWHALYDPSTQKFSDLAINGVG
jgi:hypothetical protein